MQKPDLVITQGIVLNVYIPGTFKCISRLKSAWLVLAKLVRALLGQCRIVVVYNILTNRIRALIPGLAHPFHQLGGSVECGSGRQWYFGIAQLKLYLHWNGLSFGKRQTTVKSGIQLWAGFVGWGGLAIQADCNTPYISFFAASEWGPQGSPSCKEVPQLQPSIQDRRGEERGGTRNPLPVLLGGKDGV